jgi:hypothetical protein
MWTESIQPTIDFYVMNLVLFAVSGITIGDGRRFTIAIANMIAMPNYGRLLINPYSREVSILN